MERLENLDDFKDAIMDILARHEKYVKSIDKSDFEVRNQHCLLYKWWCKKWYAHCFISNGDTCARCGAKRFSPEKII